MDFWITLALSVALTVLMNHLLKKRFPNWYQHKITPLTFLAVLLLLWGGHDFWNYVTVARQVAEHYDTPLLYYAAQREVTSGVVKVLLAGAALLAAWFRRPGRKPRGQWCSRICRSLSPRNTGSMGIGQFGRKCGIPCRSRSPRNMIRLKN